MRTRLFQALEFRDIVSEHATEKLTVSIVLPSVLVSITSY